MIVRLQAWFAASALTLALGAALGAGALALWERHAPFGWGLAQRLEKARDDLKDVKRDLGLCHANVNVLDAAIKGQNAAIDDWKRKADEAQARASAAVRTAQKASATARQQAADIMAREPGEDVCQSAFELLREP